MSGQNGQVYYVFQNSMDAAILRSAVIMINSGRQDLARNILSDARIDAARLAEMKMRSSQIIQGETYAAPTERAAPQKSRAASF